MANIPNIGEADRYNRPVPKIVTVASPKGGVGKSTIAYELAYVLDAPLIDFDWEDGSSTVAWGYVPRDRRTPPILKAGLRSGRSPRALTGRRKPDLVPCYKGCGQDKGKTRHELILKG